VVLEILQSNCKYTGFVQILCFWTLSIVLSLSKNRPVYFSKHKVSETGFCLRLQVKDEDKEMDNVQKHNICTNVLSSQTF
jgi:sporulation-control protein spo0M